MPRPLRTGVTTRLPPDLDPRILTSSLGEVQSDQEPCQDSSFGGERDSFSVSGDEEEEDSGDEHEFGEGGSKSSQSREDESQ